MIVPSSRTVACGLPQAQAGRCREYAKDRLLANLGARSVVDLLQQPKKQPMKNTLPLIAVALAGVLQAFSAGDGSTTSGSPAATTDMARVAAAGTARPAMAMTDADFAHEAAMGGMAEVALGKMATERGSDPQVKDFGKMMVADHSKANEELKGIARSKKITLPTEMDADHQALSDKLGKLSGKEFDAAYVKAMVEDHKKDLGLMQSEAAHGKDAELKAFAAKTAPVIQKHLTRIEQIHDAMK
jgi:putative membrane protein